MKKSIVLTGMMGSGKSTIGKLLAKKLKLKFVDTDLIIEKKEKKTIREIFNKKGEFYFRKVEEEICLEIVHKYNSAIALGGGAFMNDKIREDILISSNCTSFWLDVKPSLLKWRLKNVKKRPLLTQSKLEQDLKKIYNKRKEIYNEANFRISIGVEPKEEIVNYICRLYEGSKNF